MANNNLCRLFRVKGDLAGVSASVTTNDDAYLRQIAEASAEFSRQCGRNFFSWEGVRYFPSEDGTVGRDLFLGDFTSVSEVLVDEDGDGTFEKTVTIGTDATRWPLSAASALKPYRALSIPVAGSTLGLWPAFANRVKVTGVFGYYAEWELTSVTVNEGAGDGSALDTSETGITVSADASTVLCAGDVIRIDSEQIEISAVSTVTLTVVRGLNGSTAATHANGTAIYIRRYPRDVERVVAERVISGRWDNQVGYQGADGGNMNRAVYARWQQAVRDYTNPAGLF